MKFYCKKTYKLDFYFRKPIKEFLKGKEYQGKKETLSYPIVDKGKKSARKKYENVISVVGEDGRTISFTTEPSKPTKKQRPYYKDYFYTEQDMRRN